METVSALQIGVFVGCALVLLTIGALIKTIFTRTPPLHREFVGREQYDRDQAEIHEEFRRQAVGRKDLYKNVERLGSEQAAIKTEIGVHTRQLHALDSKIDDLPERIIRIIDRKGGAS